MSKYTADKTYLMTDENNNVVISYVVSGIDKSAARLAFEETKQTEKKLEIRND